MAALPPASLPRDPAEHPTPVERADARKSSGYLPSLDGWRAIAIVWVIYAHLGRNFGRISHAVADWGDHGVELFFALSGFLICTRLLREERSFGAISLKSFYVRRVFRIQPAALVYLAAIALMSLLHWIPSFWTGIVGAALMIRNFWPGQVGHQFWYTSHFWSLSVEEHFYLLLPGFLVLVRKRRLRILALAVVALDVWRDVVLGHPVLQKFGWMVYLRTDVLLAGILIGSVFAVALEKEQLRAWAQRWLKPWVALLYTAIVWTFFTLHLRRFGYQAGITVYPVLLVATTLHPASLTSRVLEWGPLRFVGRLSYSLYIWQQFFMWPVIFAPEIRLHAHPSLCVPLLFLAAMASYYWVEIPMIRYGSKLAKRFDPVR
jgi:peptidoglycan/LPS O-acetylase OafA/YrhL